MRLKSGYGFLLFFTMSFALFSFVGCVRKQQVRTTKVERSPRRLRERDQSISEPQLKRATSGGQRLRAKSRASQAPINTKTLKKIRQISDKQALIKRKISRRHVKVKEADLYRVKGNTLFYLHTFRGLVVFDLSRPAHPKILHSLPIFGKPIEMFVEKGIAYVLVSNALYLIQEQGKFVFREHRTSQLITVDISDRAKPEILQAFDLEGRLWEGVSRKIGDLIYIVSHRRSRYLPQSAQSRHSYRRRRYYRRKRPRSNEKIIVTSFNVSQKGGTRKVKELIVFDGKHAHRQTNNGVFQHDTFQGKITITANDGYLMVSEHWYRRRTGTLKNQTYTNRFFGYFSRNRHCSLSENYHYTHVSLIHLHHSNGNIEVQSQFELNGFLKDQFKQRYMYDPVTQKGVYLGVVQQAASMRHCRHSWREQRNTLVSIEATAGRPPRILSFVHFGKPNETVRGSLFDDRRKVLYAITATRRDPLYAISFKNPEELKIVSQIDGLSGDMNVFRFIEGRKFLLAVGRDTSSGCTGFERGRSRSGVAVSLIDVRDLKNIRLVQRKCVSLLRSRHVTSKVNRSRDQAHKMIGVYSKGGVNLITVPVSFREKIRFHNRWVYKNTSAIGLMRWNLSKYSPMISGSRQNVLENLGMIKHSRGYVQRTIITDLPVKGGSRRYILNVSQYDLSVVDVQDPKKPSVLASYSISLKTRGVYRFGKFFVEWKSEGSGAKQLNHFLVRRIGGDGKPRAQVEHSFVVGNILVVRRWKSSLLMFRQTLKEKRYGSRHELVLGKQMNLHVYDFSRPKKAKQISKVKLPRYFVLQNLNLCNGLKNAGLPMNVGSSSWIKLKNGFVGFSITVSQFNRHVRHRQLVFLDLRHLKKPSFKTWNMPRYQRDSYLRLVRGGNQRFHLAINGGANTTHLQTWTMAGGKWNTKHWIVIPGHLLKVFRKRGKDQYLSVHTSPSQIWLSEQKERSDKMIVKARLSLGKTRYRHGVRFTSLFHNNTLYFRHFSTGGKMRLSIIRVQNKGMKLLHSNMLTKSGANWSLLCVHRNRLLLRVNRGVLVANVASGVPKAMFFRQNRNEYFSSVTETSTHLLFAAGRSGFTSVSLKRPSLLAKRSMRKHQLKRVVAQKAHQQILVQATARAASR